jgi:hypothetical protein
VQRFQDPTAYKPGDEVNGHVLGTDNVWHSMAAVQLTTPPLRYWGRYRKRWRKTYLVFAVLAPLSWMTTPAASHDGLFLIFLNLILAATLEAAFVAAFVNLLVAIPPSASSQRLPISSVPVRLDDPPSARAAPCRSSIGRTVQRGHLPLVWHSLSSLSLWSGQPWPPEAAPTRQRATRRTSRPSEPPSHTRRARPTTRCSHRAG